MTTAREIMAELVAEAKGRPFPAVGHVYHKNQSRLPLMTDEQIKRQIIDLCSTGASRMDIREALPVGVRRVERLARELRAEGFTLPMKRNKWSGGNG